MANPGIISNTKAVEVSIQAVAPLSNSTPSSPKSNGVADSMKIDNKSNLLFILYWIYYFRFNNRPEYRKNWQ
jgi:hypothetical protein